MNLRVVYEDLPDMIELAIELRPGGWSAAVEVYVAPGLLTEQVHPLIAWTRSPQMPLKFGTEFPGAGGFSMEFRTVNAAQHVSCLLHLTTRIYDQESPWRLVIDPPTELGLVERFAQECVELGRTLQGHARLVTLFR